jgi:hypothetical protein
MVYGRILILAITVKVTKEDNVIKKKKKNLKKQNRRQKKCLRRLERC